MKLSELQPEWVNYTGDGGLRRFSDKHSRIDYSVTYPDGEVDVDAPESSEEIANADGVMFLCPVCFVKNGGPIRTEHVLCWLKDRPNVPADAVPGPGRWTASGTSFEDLTLSPSVNVDHEHWHGYVRAGNVT